MVKALLLNTSQIRSSGSEASAGTYWVLPSRACCATCCVGSRGTSPTIAGMLLSDESPVLTSRLPAPCIASWFSALLVPFVNVLVLLPCPFPSSVDFQDSLHRTYYLTKGLGIPLELTCRQHFDKTPFLSIRLQTRELYVEADSPNFGFQLFGKFCRFLSTYTHLFYVTQAFSSAPPTAKVLILKKVSMGRLYRSINSSRCLTACSVMWTFIRQES